MTISPEALEAIGAEHEAHEREIASLRRQRDHFIAANAALIEEKNGLELQLSVVATKAKLAEWQLLLRVRKLEELATALAASCDRMANHQQGLVTREEFKFLESEHYALSGRVPV